MNSIKFTHIDFTIINENGDIVHADIYKKRTMKYIRSKIQKVCEIPIIRQCFTCD
uniref:Uncharacterized protein n=1 Tax=Panagrolaimus sp. ES5 TaxID=591445 RepID=A0AC34FIE6_9BILA